MGGVTYLVLYIPICLVVLVVLEACRADDPRRVTKRALANFGGLTLVLALGSLLVYAIHRFF